MSSMQMIFKKRFPTNRNNLFIPICYCCTLFCFIFLCEMSIAEQKKTDIGQMQPPSEIPIPPEANNIKDTKNIKESKTEPLNVHKNEVPVDLSSKPDLVEMNSEGSSQKEIKKNQTTLKNESLNKISDSDNSNPNKKDDNSKKELLPKDGKPTNEFYQEKKDSYVKPSVTDEGYVYDPVGRRDPFRPYRDAKIGIGSLMGYIKNRPFEPLEKFDAKSLQVVAIIWGTSKPKALVEDPEHKIHTVYKGMRVGKNDGVIAEIREGEVIIVEVFDYNGKLTKESFILPIRK